MPQAGQPDDIVGRTEYAAALTALRERAGLSVRELARQIGTPPATLGGYFSGRHVPSVAAVPVLRNVLHACGITDSVAVDAWLEATARVRSGADGRTRDRTPPYRGLACFEVEDAQLFFGRDEETSRLLDVVRSRAIGAPPPQRVVAVVGPSGSGKSSVLRAGLVAALRAGGHAHTDEHRTATLITPQTVPVDRLAAVLAQLCDTSRPVLVVDQLEELFTSRYDLVGRERYLDALDSALRAQPDLVLVIGLRADFYAPAGREPFLLPALQGAQVLVGPLSPPRVRETITAPLGVLGLSVERGFVDVLLADLVPAGALADTQSTSALPLLSHVLLATWERSSAGRLTIEDYHRAGGIAGAIERSAEDVYAGLSDNDRRTARSLFLRLVTVDDIAVTRRHVGWSELDGLPGGAGDVVAAFVAQRLVTATEDGLDVSHEALLRAWPRLAGWIARAGELLLVHRRITEDARDWERAGRDPAMLQRGARLELAAELASPDRPDVTLTAVEHDYVEQGLAHAQAEQRREQRSTRRLRRAVAAIAVLAVVAAVLAVVSLSARLASERDRRAADAARDDALSRQTAGRAAQLVGADPALAEQLALAAYQIAPTDAARGELIDQSAHPVITRVAGSPGSTPLAVSTDGTMIAVGHATDGSVHLYRTRADRPPVPLGVIPGSGPRRQIFAMAFTPDGRTLAIGGQAGDVGLWRTSEPEHPVRTAELTPGFDSGTVQTIAISPDGRRLLAGSSDGRSPVLAWALSDHGTGSALPAPRGVPPTATIESLAFDRTGRTLAAAGDAGTLLVWTGDPARVTPAVMPADADTTIDAVAFDPTRPRLLAGDRAGKVIAWPLDVTHPRPLHTFSGSTDSQVNVLAVSPDGREFAAGSSDDSLHRWDTLTGDSLGVIDNPGPVTGVRYSPDGSVVMSTAADGSLRLQRRNERAITVRGSVFALGFSRDGRKLLVSTNGDWGAVQLWDVTDRVHPRAVTAPLRMPPGAGTIDGTGAIRPDGRLVAAASADGNVALWDVSSSARLVGSPFVASSALPEALAFSPDGSLLAVGGDDHHVTLWDVRTPSHPVRVSTMTADDQVLGVAFSPDGRLVAAASADAYAHVWRIGSAARPATPQPVARLGGFRSYVYGVSFSPDGRTLAASSSDHTTRLFAVHGDRVSWASRALIGPTDYAYAASFTPDSRMLAVASNDRIVRLYGVRPGDQPVPVASLDAAEGPLFAVAFSPDGRTVVAGGRNNSVITWSVDVDRYAGDLCPRAGTPITRSEWSLYVPGAAYTPPCR